LQIAVGTDSARGRLPRYNTPRPGPRWLLSSVAVHLLLGVALLRGMQERKPPDAPAGQPLTMLFASPTVPEPASAPPAPQASTPPAPELLPEPSETPATVPDAPPAAAEEAPATSVPVQAETPPAVAAAPIIPPAPAPKVPRTKPSRVASRPPPVSRPAVPSPARSVPEGVQGPIAPAKPAATQGPANAGPAQAAVSASPDPGWDAMLSAWLAGHKSYPDGARRRGEAGSLTLRFEVAADGRVLTVALVAGSGSEALDEAARNMLAGARLPPPHVAVSRTVRIRYRLED